MSFWDKKYNIDELQKFYRNELINTESLYLRDMWAMSDKDKEKKHDYIQWMLPIHQKSTFNRKAPVLSKHDIEILKSDALVMENMRKSVVLFLDFLGFTIDDKDFVSRADDFDTKSKNWLRKNNHNYKRITRLLIFLKLFDFEGIYHTLLPSLYILHLQHAKDIDDKTYQYWQETSNIVI